MTFADKSVKLLGWGSLVFGAWGIVDPKGLTGLMGDDPEIGRMLGVRDVVVGLTLLGATGPIPLAMRLASDIHDAVRLRERSPLVALSALAVAAWGATALAGSLRPRENRRFA